MGWGRLYFAVQAAAGAAWWVAVFLVPSVRAATLGTLDPVLIAAFDIPLFVGASALAAGGARWAAVVATAWTTLVAVGLAGWATVTGEAGVGVLAMDGAVGGSMIALCLLLVGRVPTEWVASGAFAFRPATSPSSTPRHVALTALQIVVFWGLFLGLIPQVIAFLEQRWRLALPAPDAIPVVGVVVLIVASALGIWSAVTMSTTGAGTPLPSAMANRLVVAGPYRFVRNPMAVAGITQGAAVGLILGSWLVVVYAIAGSLLWNYVIRPLEERDLEVRFGEDYRRYVAEVRCWVPRWTATSVLRP